MYHVHDVSVSALILNRLINALPKNNAGPIPVYKLPAPFSPTKSRVCLPFIPQHLRIHQDFVYQYLVSSMHSYP